METDVENIKPAEAYIPVAAPNWRSNLIWALTGAILGNLLTAPMDAGKEALLARLYQDRAGNPAATCPAGK